ncbi:MAG TPA: AAA family ATPase [Myxococcota bacterium]
MNAPTPLPVCRVAELDPPTDQPRWLVEALWTRAAVGFLAGQPKLGKTWLGLDLALSVATATPCLDTFAVPEQGDVLIYLAEDHPAGVRQRLEGLCQHRALRLEQVPVHVITAASLRLDLDRDRQRLCDTLHHLQPRLLLLDPLVRLHRRDENHAGDVAELLAFLRELQRAHDLAIMVVHHMRKSSGAHGGQALRGSGDFHAWTDSALYLTARHDATTLTAEHRDAPAPEPLRLALRSRADGSQTHLHILNPALDNRDPHPGQPPSLAMRVLDTVRAASRPLARTELRATLRVNNQRLGEVLAELKDGGVLSHSQRGWALASTRKT